jgi:hypothetical protein
MSRGERGRSPYTVQKQDLVLWRYEDDTEKDPIRLIEPLQVHGITTNLELGLGTIGVRLPGPALPLAAALSLIFLENTSDSVWAMPSARRRRFEDRTEGLAKIARVGSLRSGLAVDDEIKDVRISRTGKAGGKGPDGYIAGNNA